MFEVGNVVQVKSFPEIEKEDRKRGLSLPAVEERDYCGKWGKIIEIRKSSGRRNVFCVRLNILKDFWWYSCELNSLRTQNTNFILLHACLS